MCLRSGKAAFAVPQACFPNRTLEANSLDLVLGESFLRAIVKLGGSRALVRSHFLGVLKRTAIGEIGGDPGGTERVAADRLGNAGRRGTPSDHAPGIGLAHRSLGQHASV